MDHLRSFTPDSKINLNQLQTTRISRKELLDYWHSCNNNGKEEAISTDSSACMTEETLSKR